MNLFVLLLIFEIFVFVGIVVRTLRQTEIVDIKSTKYFIPLFFVNFVIYGYCFFAAGFDDVLYKFNETWQLAVKACLLQFDFDIVQPFIENDVMFHIDVIGSYILSLITVIYVFLALTGRYISNFIRCKKILFSKKEKVVIVGFNNDAASFLKTIQNKNILIWVTPDEKQLIKSLLSKKKLHIIMSHFTHNSFKKFKNSPTTFISFLKNNEDMLKLIEGYLKAKGKNFNLHVSIENRHDNTFKNAFSEKNVNFFNKYSLVAKKFISDYPLTSQLPDQAFDEETASIKSDHTINVFLFGYGSTNRNLLYDMIIDNQLPCVIDGKFAHKKINYYAFDKDEITDKLYNFNYTRFKHADLDTKKFFPLPDEPCNLEFLKYNISSLEFKQKLEEIFDKTPKTKTHNFVIVSAGDDLENIDNTLHIYKFFNEHGLTNTKFFTRIRLSAHSHMLDSTSKIVPFGEFDILNYDTIIGEDLNKLSVDRNFKQYLHNEEVAEQLQAINAIRSVRGQTEELNKLKLSLWNRVNIFDREFNSYNSINIRTKLNLLRLDTVGSSPISNKEYFELYDNLNEIEYKDRIKQYNYPYPSSLSKRNSLAFQEQLHTNAYLVCQGYLPLEKSQVLNKNRAKFFNYNHEERKGIKLTTFDGLDEIIEARREWVKNEMKTAYDKEELQNLENVDLKKSLYQVMDNIPLYKYSNYIIYQIRNDKKRKRKTQEQQ